MMHLRDSLNLKRRPAVSVRNNTDYSRLLVLCRKLMNLLVCSGMNKNVKSFCHRDLTGSLSSVLAPSSDALCS